MTNKERLEYLRKSLFQSANEQGEGIYRTVELDLDDFMFLLREAEKANQ